MNSEAHVTPGQDEAKADAESPYGLEPTQPGEVIPNLDGQPHTELVPALAMVSAPVAEPVPQVLRLPDHLKQIAFQVELRVPLSRFTLRDLQQLKAGDLLLTEHLSVRDLVLTAAGERLLLVELEAIEQQLAARVKRLAWRHKWRRQA